MKNVSRTLAAVLIVGAVGCHLRPDFSPPGTMDTQRSRAMLHDPYPSTDQGPAIAGSRPLGFDQPRTEINRLQAGSRGRGGQYVPGGF